MEDYELITLRITKSQFEALTEWKPLLVNTLRNFKCRIFSEGKDLSYTAPEVIKEQEVLKHRINLMTNLVSFIKEIEEKTEWKS